MDDAVEVGAEDVTSTYNFKILILFTFNLIHFLPIQMMKMEITFSLRPLENFIKS